jgi:hypothetical protein
MTETWEPARPGFVARLGWRAERRPRPGFAHQGATAGVFTPIAVVAFVAEPDDGDETPRVDAPPPAAPGLPA